jgi:hypothetical protein
MAAPVTLEPRSRLRARPRRPAAGAPTPPSRAPRLGLYAGLALASLVLGAASLLLSASPSYDPWSWIVWGREVLHLKLVTIGGPTWKPLPVLFTTAFAPFGAAAPALWLLVARAGGILGLAFAGVLAARLTPRGARAPAATLSAALAVAGLLLLSGYLDSVASGESEGLLVAAGALAILRHLDGRPRQAFALGLLAALIRPEAWPFFGLYAIHLWRHDPGARRLIAAAAVLIPVLWFGPELWGAHSVLRGVRWAQHPRPGSPALAACPFCAELTGHAWPLLVAPWKAGCALALALAAAARARRGPALALATATATATPVVLAALALAWIAEEAVLTQTGFSGSDRYLIAPIALLIVVGAAGWGAAVHAVTARRALPAALALGLLAVATSAAAAGHLASLPVTAARQRAGDRLQTEIARAVRVGGPRRLLGCGPIQTNPSEAPLAAWALKVPLLSTESSRGDVVIQSRDTNSPALKPAPGRGARLLARAGGVRIYARCAR